VCVVLEPRQTLSQSESSRASYRPFFTFPLRGPCCRLIVLQARVLEITLSTPENGLAG
jgi:hypothetical protein